MAYYPLTTLRKAVTPLATLLNPREMAGPLLVMAGLGVVGSVVGMTRYEWPLWGAAALILSLLLVPMMVKWRADRLRYGTIAMGLSFLLTTQGFHTIEHLVQWAQYHLLNWTLRASSGILSPANSEWVHFIWNWLVFLGVVFLIRAGWRNQWAWLLFLIAAAHTIEHTYTFTRYLMILDQLKLMGVTNVTAQGLPGIVGQGGWLAQSAFTQGTFICRLPGLTTAPRLDVHFWWNALEITPLILGTQAYLRSHLPQNQTLTPEHP